MTWKLFCTHEPVVKSTAYAPPLQSARIWVDPWNPPDMRALTPGNHHSRVRVPEVREDVVGVSLRKADLTCLEIDSKPILGLPGYMRTLPEMLWAYFTGQNP